MKKNAKRALAVLFSILGTVLGLYIGGYLLFVRSVYWLYVAFTSGSLTASILIVINSWRSYLVLVRYYRRSFS